MPPDEDPEFQARADAHIDLSNSQMEKASRGKVSASMMYSVARFNAWVSACGYDSGEEMREKKSETIGRTFSSNTQRCWRRTLTTMQTISSAT